MAVNKSAVYSVDSLISFRTFRNNSQLVYGQVRWSDFMLVLLVVLSLCLPLATEAITCMYPRHSNECKHIYPLKGRFAEPLVATSVAYPVRLGRQLQGIQ